MSGQSLNFSVHRRDSVDAVTLTINHFVIAGWTGRDKAAVEKHIAELEELGVKRPASTPVYYRASCARLTQAPAIECTGPDSSGEVEFMLVEAGGERYLGIGSDHTDRTVEAYGITVSKQVCDKPVGRDLWLLADVTPHWDQLMLRSWAVINGERVLYQQGSVATMLPPEEVRAGYNDDASLAAGSVMLCGTLAAIGGIRSASRFEFEIEDPVLGRKIQHAYDVVELPVVG